MTGLRPHSQELLCGPTTAGDASQGRAPSTPGFLKASKATSRCAFQDQGPPRTVGQDQGGQASVGWRDFSLG